MEITFSFDEETEALLKISLSDIRLTIPGHTYEPEKHSFEKFLYNYILTSTINPLLSTAVSKVETDKIKELINTKQEAVRIATKDAQSIKG